MFRVAETNTERITNVRDSQSFLSSLVSTRGQYIKLNGIMLNVYRAIAFYKHISKQSS